jgi:DNA-damage-inducible protein J
MPKTAVIHARTDENIKKQAETILKMLGISTTDAINMFLCQIVINKGLPFEVKIPNKTTLKAMKAVENNTDVVECEDIDDLLRKLKS